MKTLLTAIAVTLFMTAMAQAENQAGSTMLAGGPIWNQNQNWLYCQYINLGSANVTPTSQQIYEYGTTTPLPSAGTCANGSPVAPHQTCSIYPQDTLPSTPGMSCELTFSTSAAHVRGALELYDSNLNLLATVELR